MQVQEVSESNEVPESNDFTDAVKPSFVYFLESDLSKSTYIGATIDVDRRLRQHNQDIKGGAHATGMRVNRGETWSRICYVSEFPDWTAALQFEWRWKQLSRKLPHKLPPRIRRLKALHQLLSFDKPTTKSILYSSWPVPPKINWTDTNTQKTYDNIL